MLRFEWNLAKATTNRKKHGVEFEDALFVFEDPYAIFEPDRPDESGDLRWHVIGTANGVAVLWVVHTVRPEGEDEVIRIISARQAARKERLIYEQNRSQDIG